MAKITISEQMNKKSLLFSLSIFLLASTLLSMSFLVYDYTYRDSSERLMEISALDRVYDLSASIENSLSDVLNLSFISPALIIENGDGTYNVTISESISGDRQEWSSELEETMQNFEQFVEQRENNVDIDIEAIEDKELPFEIIPHNITYSRSWGTGHVTLSVVPEQINFEALKIIIDSGDVEISSMNSNFGSSGNVLFSVRAIDDYGYNNLKEDLVNPVSNSEVQIFFEGGNQLKVTLHDNNLEIWTNSPEIMNVSTTIGNLEDLGERPTLDYSGSILIISFPGLGISMASPLIPQ